MEEQKFGTEGIKKILEAGFTLGTAVSTALSDGFQAIPDILAVSGPGMNLATTIKGTGAQAKQEFGEFSPEERADVVSWFESKFDIKDDSAEEKIESIFDMVIVADRVRVAFKAAA